MTNKTKSSPRFTVYLHPRLGEELHGKFSLLPELNRNRLHDELPKLHPAKFGTGTNRRLSKRPRVFRGRFDMSNVGFTYLQIGDRLHILEFWFDSTLIRFPGRRYEPQTDVVIGEGPTARRKP